MNPLDQLKLNMTRRHFFAAGSNGVGAAAVSGEGGPGVYIFPLSDLFCQRVGFVVDACREYAFR